MTKAARMKKKRRRVKRTKKKKTIKKSTMKKKANLPHASSIPTQLNNRTVVNLLLPLHSNQKGSLACPI